MRGLPRDNPCTLSIASFTLMSTGIGDVGDVPAEPTSPTSVAQIRADTSPDNAVGVHASVWGLAFRRGDRGHAELKTPPPTSRGGSECSPARACPKRVRAGSGRCVELGRVDAPGLSVNVVLVSRRQLVRKRRSIRAESTGCADPLMGGLGAPTSPSAGPFRTGSSYGATPLFPPPAAPRGGGGGGGGRRCL